MERSGVGVELSEFLIGRPGKTSPRTWHLSKDLSERSSHVDILGKNFPDAWCFGAGVAGADTQGVVQGTRGY